MNTRRYGGRKLWKWIGLYVVIGAVVYFAAYAVYAYTRPHTANNATTNSPTDATTSSGTSQDTSTPPAGSTPATSSNSDGGFFNY